MDTKESKNYFKSVVSILTEYPKYCDIDDPSHPYGYNASEHFMASIDNVGGFLSLSRFSSSPPKKYDIVLSTVIRAHDNLRNSHVYYELSENSESLKEQLIQRNRKTGYEMIPISYLEMRKIMADCLLRMSKSGKKLSTWEERATVLMYDLHSSLSKPLITLPAAEQAPDVLSLWKVFIQPCYFNIHFEEDLHPIPAFQTIIKAGWSKYNPFTRGYFIVASAEKIKKTISLLSADEYIRERVYHILRYQALWHYLQNEVQICSWLLFEAQYIDPQLPGAKDAFENSIVVNLLVNKLFDTGVPITQDLMDQSKENGGSWRIHCLLYNQMFAMHVDATGALPPNFPIISTDYGPLADKSVAASASSAVVDYGYGSLTRILNDFPSFNVKVCAVCSRTDLKLLLCSKCKTVAYCSKEHQVADWKKKHKQQCKCAEQPISQGPGTTSESLRINVPPERLEEFLTSHEGGDLPYGIANIIMNFCFRFVSKSVTEAIVMLSTEDDGFGMILMDAICEKADRPKIKEAFRKAIEMFSHPSIITCSEVYEKCCEFLD